MMSLKHLIRVKIRSSAILFREIRAFYKVKKRVAEAALVIDLDFDTCFLLRQKIWEWLPAASLVRRVLHHF